ncbi:hypothetical protein LCM17_23075 [Cereibacter sphaeroides]|nr:hypothetical protein [Cereibacter sphaeroides]
MRLIARRNEAIKAVARQMGLKLQPEGEKDRLVAIKAAAQAPERCGPEIPVAPARGPMVAFAPKAMRPTAEGYELQHVGFQGRDAARAADVFDTMALQARRRGGHDPFTARQVDAGRLYAALVERHSSVGLKCVSVEAQGRGGKGSGGGSYMDAVVAEGDVIRRLEAAIGTGFALEVQRARDSKRRSITLRRIVDMVCLEGRTVTDALKANGWSIKGDTVTEARNALAAALERMSVVAPGTR